MISEGSFLGCQFFLETVNFAGLIMMQSRIGKNSFSILFPLPGGCFSLLRCCYILSCRLAKTLLLAVEAAELQIGSLITAIYFLSQLAAVFFQRKEPFQHRAPLTWFHFEKVGKAALRQYNSTGKIIRFHSQQCLYFGRHVRFPFSDDDFLTFCYVCQETADTLDSNMIFRLIRPVSPV